MSEGIGALSAQDQHHHPHTECCDVLSPSETRGFPSAFRLSNCIPSFLREASRMQAVCNRSGHDVGWGVQLHTDACRWGSGISGMQSLGLKLFSGIELARASVFGLGAWFYHRLTAYLMAARMASWLSRVDCSSVSQQDPKVLSCCT